MILNKGLVVLCGCLLFAFTITALPFSTILAQDQHQFVVTESDVVFSSRTQIERFDGITSAATGSFNTETGHFRFEVPVDSIRTGNNRRDAKMREDYLLSEDNPYIKFNGLVQNWQSASQTNGEYIAKGTFSIAGFEREVEIPGNILFQKTENSENTTVEISSTFDIKLSDYNITRPRFLLVRLNDVQEVSVSFVLSAQSGN
ncbi:YceI family protein [Cyclonatronum proteinivorum]|uniref:YceI family protein n=1 Tax=Cyclonatronum proteinivorum TaxID=1457365 RepID=UPI0013DE7F3F|nr:YceI family protein [Cyclonatronum proteinivorum]